MVRFSENLEMKVLFVSDFYYPHIGGVTEHIYHLANEFERMGHQVSILTADIEGSLKPDERRVIRLGKSMVIPMNESNARMTGWVNLSMLSSIVNKYDVIHIHGIIAPTLPLLSLKVSKRTNIFTFHPTFDSSNLYKIFKNYLKHYFEKIDGRIAVSTTARDSICKYFPVDYRIIPNGVDPVRFKNTGEKRNSFEILFVGRIEPRKGLQFLIDALPDIKEDFPKVKLTVAGGGYKGMRLSVPEEIKDSIEFLGFVPPTDLPRIFSKASVFVSPAITGESFGIVLLESMATQTPVIASDIPGYRCVIEDGDNGILVKPGDSKDIAKKIICLFKNRNLCKNLVKGGQRTVKKYAWSNVAKDIVNFYYEVNPSLP
jgi:phosphatidylinositol alpha-mannosyltransferase